jgi:branched-chain amino acid transport system permease protein
MSLLIPIIVTGCVTALVALAFQVVIQATGGMADFAMGQYVVLSGLMYVVGESRGWPLGVSVLLAVALAVGCAMLSEFLVVRPLDRMSVSSLQPVVATIALLYIWEQVSSLIFGESPRRGSELVQGTVLEIGGVSVTGQQAVIIGTTVFVFVALAAWARRSATGRRLRAVGDNPGAAELLGFRRTRTSSLAFGIAGAVAGLAGILSIALSGLGPANGAGYTLAGIVALYLGGTKTPMGALVGGLLLAALTLLTGRYIGSAFPDYALLVLAVILFAFRPQGLIAGTKVRVG